MLWAEVVWVRGIWAYVVRDGAAALEVGVVRGAGEGDAGEDVVFLLRHRWPALVASACVVLHGPQATSLPARPGGMPSARARRRPKRVRNARSPGVRAAG